MKHLIIYLICLGACLTASAAAPLTKTADFTKVNHKVMMTNKPHMNTFMSMKAENGNGNGNSFMTPRDLFKKHHVTPNDNRLAKKAPRRLADDDIASNDYLDFRYVYKMGDDGLEWDDYHFRGGEGVYWDIYEGQLYCAGLYWSQYTGSTWYLPIDIDYTTGEVTLPTGVLLEDDTIEGEATGGGSNWRRTDTVNYSILVDYNWYIGESEDFSDIPGTLYVDGSIEFSSELPYVFAGYQALVTYKRSGSSFSGYTYSVVSSDTTWFEEIYVGTQFIVPNATHDYDIEASSTRHCTEDVYMYQFDTTAVVFNLYGLGMPGFEMNIHCDGSMVMPLDWPVGEIDPRLRNYYADYYGSDYNWDNVRWYWVYNLDENDELTGDTEIVGTVEPSSIRWDRACYVLPNIVRVSDGASMILPTYPLTNNVLSFTDGSEFVLPCDYYPVRGDVNNDDEIDIYDIITLIDHLRSGDYDDSDEFSLDNADCNWDGEIGWDDIEILYNYFETGSWPNK
ncbi:MAG: hypothetical protein IKZ92_00435 [Muribaculaceae bacterium]|nr:hypothetical protein [Muribaculaceae bacterium]